LHTNAEGAINEGIERYGPSQFFRSSFLNFVQTSGSRSHNLHAKPGPRDHFQITLVGAAHGMIAAINCTQDICPCVIASQVLDQGCIHQNGSMNSHESKGCQFLFSSGHRFPHKIGTGLVHKSDIVPLGIGHSHIERIDKENPASCLDCDSCNRTYVVIDGRTVIIHEHFPHL